MLNRLIRFTLVGVFATAIAGYGVSYAQDDDDDDMGDVGEEEMDGDADADTDADADADADTEGEGEGEGEGEAVAEESTDVAVAPGVYSSEEVNRPVQLYTGMFEVGVGIGLPKGPDDTGELGIGNWMGLTIRADYGVSDKIQAGVRLPLAPLKPDLGDLAKPFGGLVLDGRYAVIAKPDMMLSAGTGLIYGFPGPAAISSYGVPMFADVDGMKLGFTPGVNFKKPMGKLAITADPGLVLIMDGAAGADGAEMLTALIIPVAVHYQVGPMIAAGLRTGIYSGHEFKFSADDGATMPFILEGQYSLMEGKVDVGANIGLGTVLAPEGADIGDTLFIGLFANYRNK